MEPASAMQDLTLPDGWLLQLGADSFRLANAGTNQGYVVPKAEALDGIERIGLDGASPSFVLLSPKRMRIKMQPAQAEAFKAWLGPDYRPELRHHVKNRMKFALPVGILILLTAGTDWMSWVLGGLLLAGALLGRFRPSPAVYLVDALFWVGLIASNGMRMAADPGVLPAVMAFLAFLFLVASIHLFARFRTALKTPP